jgi:Flp pilus assembly pilin Flp
MKKVFTILVATLLVASVQLNAQWTQIGQDIDGEVAIDKSGYSVSLSDDGSIIAVGAINNDGNGTVAGHVRVYENISGTWTQIGNDIDGEAAGDLSGWTVSLSADGTIVAIGAPFNDSNGNDAGHVRVYQNMAGNWIQIGNDIDGEASGDQSGAVSLSAAGNIVAIGAIFNDGNGTNAGHVRIYENLSGSWIQIGSDIDGEAAYDGLGRSVSLSADGTIVAIGAPFNAGNGTHAGHVRIYKNLSGNWTQIGQDIEGEALDGSGFSVSLSADGTVIGIGAPYNSANGTDAGRVRIYANLSGNWTQIGQDIEGEAAEDRSGESVSLSADGNTVAIGAWGNDANGSNSGHVRVYKNTANIWTQVGNDIDGEAAGDLSGWSVSLSSDGAVVAVGAPYNQGTRVYSYNNVGINKNLTNLEQIYPNPNKGVFVVENIEDYSHIQITTMIGDEVFSKEIKANSIEIDIATLPKGIYLLHCIAKEQRITQKIIIQ